MNIKYNLDYHKDKFGKIIDNDEGYRARGEFVSSEIFKDNFKEGSKVLEFGCGVGQNLIKIKNAYGYDINKKLYPLLNKKGIKTFNTLKEIPDKFFDEILLSMVLEHLQNPIKTINLLKRKLKGGGNIRIIVPKLNYDFKKDLNKSIDGHIFGWSFYELNYLLNYCGFVNILNKKLYNRGYERFVPLYRFGLYPFFVKNIGRLLNQFDILVVAKKK